MTMTTTAPTPQNPVGRPHSSSSVNDDASSENQQQPQQRSPRPLAEKVAVVWRWPWTIALTLFFLFTLLWTYGVVIRRYWILENWNDALPGLGDSAFRKISMRFHMTFGAIAILCSPIQLITPFTKGFRRKASTTTTSSSSAAVRNLYRTVHRYVGRVYVMCGMLAFVFGQWFICLKEFRLVGGYNMGAAFSLGGFFIGYFAYMTWKTAPSNNKNNQNQNQKQKYTIEDHRNYAIRSFSQIIAPVLYRYWYTAMVLLKVYRTPYLNNGDINNSKDLVCDDHNVCPDYLRPLDAIFCWLYWISAWIVAEVVIACLPKYKTTTNNTIDNNSIDVNDTNMQEEEHLTTQTPLLTEQPDGGVINNSDNDNDDAVDVDDDNNSNDKSLVSVVNFVGCLLAGATFMVTGLILIAVIQQ